MHVTSASIAKIQWNSYEMIMVMMVMMMLVVMEIYCCEKVARKTQLRCVCVCVCASNDIIKTKILSDLCLFD